MCDCLKIIVIGRVQGVYFRAFTQKQANKRNISGYAKNLPNGNVEIIACGDKVQLKQLVDWCHKGPVLAKVNEVKIQSWSTDTIPKDFIVL